MICAEGWIRLDVYKRQVDELLQAKGTEVYNGQRVFSAYDIKD